MFIQPSRKMRVKQLNNELKFIALNYGNFNWNNTELNWGKNYCYADAEKQYVNMRGKKMNNFVYN